MVMHSEHNERKKEIVVNILLENYGTSKKMTLSLHSLQSAVCSLHGLRFNMTAVYRQVATRLEQAPEFPIEFSILFSKVTFHFISE